MNEFSCDIMSSSLFIFFQNDAIIQQLAAIFSHCFGPAPLPAVPEMKATLSAQLGRESMILLHAHEQTQLSALERETVMVLC